MSPAAPRQVKPRGPTQARKRRVLQAGARSRRVARVQGTPSGLPVEAPPPLTRNCSPTREVAPPASQRTLAVTYPCNTVSPKGRADEATPQDSLQPRNNDIGGDTPLVKRPCPNPRHSPEPNPSRSRKPRNLHAGRGSSGQANSKAIPHGFCAPPSQYRSLLISQMGMQTTLAGAPTSGGYQEGFTMTVRPHAYEQDSSKSSSAVPANQPEGTLRAEFLV